MDDIFTSIIGLAIAAILMFIFPLITMSDRTDDVAQLTVDIATTEFVDNIRKTGVITPEEYGKFIENIGSTGNTYNVEIEIKILDENPKRSSINNGVAENNKNIYYSIYNTQVEEALNNNKNYYLKEGDLITISVKNSNQTLSQQLKNLLYTVMGNDTYIIAASHGGLVLATGK